LISFLSVVELKCWFLFNLCLQELHMKLEYLEDLLAGGKYDSVVSENLIRLYDFSITQTDQLIALILKHLIDGDNNFELGAVEFIQPVNCLLTLQLANTDKGILKTEQYNNFICFFDKG